MFESENSLKTIRESIDVGPNPWVRLTESTAKMSPEQISWTLEQESVKDSWDKMFEGFKSWIFERFKDEFSREKAYQPLIDAYISSVLNCAQGFGQRAQELEEENARLRAQLEELRNANRLATN